MLNKPVMLQYTSKTIIIGTLTNSGIHLSKSEIIFFRH